jgi:hypothetical protein
MVINNELFHHIFSIADHRAGYGLDLISMVLCDENHVTGKGRITTAVFDTSQLLLFWWFMSSATWYCNGN